MSESISTWQRLRHTPLRDVIRGRLTARLDLQAKLAASGLPAAARELIARVVRRTRLWRIEKVAVADELIAHFLDGQDAGEPAEQLIERFGDETQAAKLIRRGKIRNRPLAWHALRWATRGLLVLIAIYGLAATRYFSGSPSPSVDYVAQLNQPLAGVAEAERGWPVYLPVMRKLSDLEIGGPRKDGRLDAQAGRRWELMADAVPGSRYWPAMMQWLTENAADVEQIRFGAAKPVLGFVLGAGGSARDRLSPEACGSPSDPDLMKVLLPHLNDMRVMANLLQSDARAARLQGDGVRLRRDIEALLNMQRQMQDDPGRFIVCDLVAIGIRDQALQVLDETLSQSPALLSDADLVALAHTISQPKRAADLLSFKLERISFHDVLQRTFTDDGHGDGRLTPRGLEQLLRNQAVSHIDPRQPPYDPLRPTLLGPGAMMVVASRQDQQAAYDRLLDQAEAQLARPMRETEWDSYLRQIAALRSSDISLIRYLPVCILAPALNHGHRKAEICIARQEGLAVGIALELHRRRHGGYPQSLAELSPQLLPAVPADRITGEPVKYRLKDGKPVVYSVGANRVDDGGTLFQKGRVSAYAAAWGDRVTGNALEGDWVLYPYPVQPIEELEDVMVDEENVRH